MEIRFYDCLQEGWSIRKALQIVYDNAFNNGVKDGMDQLCKRLSKNVMDEIEKENLS